jgi:hypothetical protein
MKIDLGSNVVTLTITEEDLIPMLQEYVQQRLGAGMVKVNMCLTEPCCVEFTPTLQPTQAHRNIQVAGKDLPPPPPPFPPTTKTVRGRWVPSSNHPQQDDGGWLRYGVDAAAGAWAVKAVGTPPEFPKTRSTRRSSWWSLVANTDLEDGIHPKY